MTRRPQRVADPQHHGLQLWQAPERVGGVQVGGDQVRKLRIGAELLWRLYLGVVQRRVRSGAVVRVPAHEDELPGAVVRAVLEDGARAAQIDAVALLGVGDERGNGGHVDHRFGPMPPEHLLGAALADVHRVQLDLRRSSRPAARVDPDHLVPFREQPLRHLAREQPRDPGDQHFHGRPRSISSAMRRFT